MAARQGSGMRRRDLQSAPSPTDALLGMPGPKNRPSPSPTAAGELKGGRYVPKHHPEQSSSEEEGMESEDAPFLLKGLDVVVDDTEVEKGCCNNLFTNFKSLFAPTPGLTRQEAIKLVAELNKEVARLKAQADEDIARFEAKADATARRCNQEVHRLKRAAVLKSEEVQAIEAAAKRAVARLQATVGELGGEVEDLKAKREEDAQRHAVLMAGLREANERLVKANEESLQTVTLLREEMRVKDRELQQQARELEKRELLLQMKDQQLLDKDAALAAAVESAKVLQTAMRNQTHRSAGHVAAAEKANAALIGLKAEHLALQQKTERVFYVMADWKIVRCLGEGGQGRAYQVERKTSMGIEQTAVLKIFKRGGEAKREHMLLSEPCLRGFAPAAMEYLDMQDVYDEDQELEGGMVLMQFVKGTTLDALPEGWFKQPTNVDMLLREGLRFLAVLHKNRVSHRDIKPENFMWDGRLQAIDWGMGRSQRVLAFRNNEAFENAGSLSFMAPEVVTGLATDQLSMLSDVLSFGLMLVDLIYTEHYNEEYYTLLQSWKPFLFQDAPPPSDAASLISAYVEERNFIAEMLEESVGDKELSVWAKDVLLAMVSVDLEERAAVLLCGEQNESMQLEGIENLPALMGHGEEEVEDEEDEVEEEDDESEEGDF